MSRLSAAFVLNYLTRIVPSLGHVGKKMKPDRVVKGAAILAAIGGVFTESPAWAATFTWATATTPVATGPVGTAYPISGSGVSIRLNFAPTNGVTVNGTIAPGNIGGAASPAAPSSLGVNITNTNVVPNGAGPFGNLGIRARFVNAAEQIVPVNGLVYRVVDIDKDDSSDFKPFYSAALWQDQITTFALNGTDPLAITGVRVAEALGNNGAPLVGTVQPITAALATTGSPAAALGTVATTPTQALSFLGVVDPDPNNFGPEGITENDQPTLNPLLNYLQEASNRSQEGSVSIGVNAGQSATEFVVLYGDGSDIATTQVRLSTPPPPVQPIPLDAAGNPVPLDASGDPIPPATLFRQPVPPAQRNHGLGILGRIDFEPAIIGVRKQVTAVAPNGDGSFTVTYVVEAENIGTVDLRNVKLDDNLTADPTTYDQSSGNFNATNVTGLSIVPGSLQSVALTGLGAGVFESLNNVAGAYTGSGAADQLLTATGNTLDVGQRKAVRYQVRFTPTGAAPLPQQFDSQVVVSGETLGGGITRDRSNDGANIEDGVKDKDPTQAGSNNAPFGERITGANFDASTGFLTNLGAGDDTVTSFILPTQTPQIGVTKQVLSTTPVPGSPGSYDVTYRQIVRNVSGATVTNPRLTNVQLNESLAGTFRLGTPTGAGSAVVQPLSIRSLDAAQAAAQGFTNPGFQPLGVNTGFNGIGSNDLLTSANVLDTRGSYGVVDYTVRVSPQAGGPALESPTVGFFDSQIRATADFANPSVPDSVLPTFDLSDDVTSVAGAPIPVPADDAVVAADYQSQVPRIGFPANTPAGPQPRPSADPDGPAGAARNRNNLTPVSFAPQAGAKIAIGKRVTNVIDNRDGTFNVTYRQIVQNTGTERLINVNVTEDLDTTFRTNSPTTGARAFQVVQGSVIAPASLTVPVGTPGVFRQLTPGGSFDGKLGGNPVMATAATLDPGEYGVVDFTVLVTPGNTAESYGFDGPGANDGPFNGQARAVGQVQDSSNPVQDLSKDLARFPQNTPTGGTIGVADVLDPIDTPTPVQFPQIAVAKRVSNVQRTGQGTAADPFVYQVEYTVVTTNVGAVRLENVQTTEPTLASVFPGVAGTTYVPNSLQAAPGTQVTPPGLNSAGLFSSTQGLFSAPLALDPGQSTTVLYRVSVSNPPEGVTFTSQSTATGDGDPAPTVPTGTPDQGGIPVLTPSDKSDDGPFVDQIATDGLRGRGPSEDNPTPVEFPSAILPRIGLTKQVFGTPVNRGDGTYDVTFRYEVRNTGGVPLNNVTIADDLDRQFLLRGRESALTPNPVDEYIGLVGRPTFIQGTPVNLGTGSGIGLEDDTNNPANAIATIPTLPVGGSSVVQVVVRIRPGEANLNNVYEGAALAKGDVSEPLPGTPPQVTDISDDGTYINNVPARPSDRPGLFGPEVPGVNDATLDTKNPTPVIFAQSQSEIALYKAITAAPGETFTQPLNVVTPPISGVVGVSSLPRNLTNGDVVEYSLYIFNRGPAQPGFEVCDPLRAGQAFVPGSATSTPSGITAQAFGPLAIPAGPSSLGRTCNLVPGTDGQSPFAGGTVVFPNFTLQPGLTTLKFNVRIQR
jgi:uncharacterized repeat protein (TIGR01451 family)